MKRSERLAKEGKIEVYIGSFEIAKIISMRELMSNNNLRYLGTDYDARFNGLDVHANVYEDEQTDELVATIG